MMQGLQSFPIADSTETTTEATILGSLEWDRVRVLWPNSVGSMSPCQPEEATEGRTSPFIYPLKIYWGLHVSGGVEAGGRCPRPGQSEWIFIPCGLKFQDKNSKTIETGGCALPRQHISLPPSKKITHTQKDYLKVMWWSDAKGSDEKGCSTHRPLQ